MGTVSRLLLLCSVTASPLAGQVLEGVVTSGTTPVRYALVTLRDSAGREVGRTTSDTEGRFRLEVASHGPHRITASRVGHRPWRSEPMAFGAGLQPVALALPDQPVTLPALRPEATGRCRVRPALGAATEILLDAARTGLGVAEVTTRSGHVLAGGEVRRRFLDSTLAVQAEDTRTLKGRLDWPFRILSPAGVAQGGFISGDFLTGPDSRILESDWFLRTHCFDLALPEPPADSIVGVTFRPDSPATRPDVEGTLWLDRRTLRLLRLEFRWTGLDPAIRRNVAGAELDFLPLPGGGLVLGGWWVRTPLAPETPAPRWVETMFLEEEGEVTEVLPGRPTP